MKNNNFFELLKYSNSLKQQNKFLSKENPELFRLLTRFLGTIEVNYHYSKKHQYMNLINDFLKNKMTLEEFSYEFRGLFGSLNQKSGLMVENESPQLENLLNETRQEEFAKWLYRTYSGCDNLGLDVTVEDLQDCIQNLLAELKK